MLAGSLAYSVYITQKDQAFAYFSTFARVWEFALGGLVAIVLPELRLPLAVRIGFGWQFHGCYPELRRAPERIDGVPRVCGALANVRCSADYHRRPDPVALCSRSHPKKLRSLFGYVGKISYALYLWHWPILIFYLIIFDVTHAGIVGGAAVFGLSIVLAAISTWIVEDERAMEDRTRSERHLVVPGSCHCGCRRHGD